MRNIFIYFFIIVFAVSFSCIQKYDNYLEINQIEQLMSKRIDIINNFLYSEKDMLKLRTELSKVEEGKLFMADMELLTKVYCNPSDYEKIDKLIIKNVDKIEVSNSDVEMLCKIVWQSFLADEKSVATNLVKDYNIKCIKKDKNLYLTNLEAIN